MISYHLLGDEDVQKTKNLICEYIKWINIDLSFQNIQEELRTFPNKYKAPFGGFIISKDGGKVIGCVGLRRIDRDICEMKRLYVTEGYRGKGIGEELVALIIMKSKEMGYSKIRLDTLEKMKGAQNLYKKNGFYEIKPYIFNPIRRAIYFEKDLNRG